MLDLTYWSIKARVVCCSKFTRENLKVMADEALFAMITGRA